jgi:3-hydroxy-9,10-secoandrosta-1,3,5(10)-triene-9,17-dione monooxygenase
MMTTLCTSLLTAEELLRRASEMVPRLKKRAAYTEHLRRLPDETVQDILASGLHRIAVPKRYGGLDVGYPVMLAVGAELARGCAATAWCYSLWSAHAWLVGHWPLEAQEAFFADGPDVLCSSSLSPSGVELKPVTDGFRLSGRWEFSSGCDAAGWLILGAMASGALRWSLVPRSDVEIVDTWFVSGLRGTGSKDIVVDDAFVPAHRALNMARAGDGDWTGWEIHGQARYRLPIAPLLGWDLVSPMVGIGQGMIDEFTAQLTGTSGPGRTAESAAVQIRLAEASAAVDAARTLMWHDVGEMLGKAKRGEALTMLERARYRRDKAFIVGLCLGAVNRLFDLSGGHSLFDAVPLQRFHRDAQAVAHREGLIMDLAGQQYGRVALGLEPTASRGL